jgi:hypothetical protein
MGEFVEGLEGGTYYMMPQKEVSEAIYQQADPDYGRYEGNSTSSARQHDETSNEQDLKEGPSGKVYPFPRDNTNIMRFILALIALGLLLLFCLLFVVMIGGTVGWASFAVACFALFAIAGIGIISLHPRR